MRRFRTGQPHRDSQSLRRADRHATLAGSDSWLRRHANFISSSVCANRPSRCIRCIFHSALQSCLEVNRPEAIHFHFRNEPYGPLWERILPHLTLHRLGKKPRDYDTSRYAETAEGRLIAHLGLGYAHEADFVRLDALIEHGGVYADMDTLFVRRYPDAWFRHEFLVGEEPGVRGDDGLIKPSLCNAVMFAHRGARLPARGVNTWDALSMAHGAVTRVRPQHHCGARIRSPFCPKSISMLFRRHRQGCVHCLKRMSRSPLRSTAFTSGRTCGGINAVPISVRCAAAC